jgi:hypothetical protein
MVLKSADTDAKPPFCQVLKNYVEYLPIFFDRAVHTKDTFAIVWKAAKIFLTYIILIVTKKIHFVEKHDNF